MTEQQPPQDHRIRDLIRDAHDQTLFIQAGAGTGKTTALVMRVVEMVATGVLEQMAGLAAITFTENAAAELRTRIREGLEQAAHGEFEKRTYTPDQQDRCRAALGTLDEAAISTLHGFAARILSEVPIEAGLPPGFSVSDAITAQLDTARAWRQFLDDLLDDPEVQHHVVAGLTLGLDLGRLRELAESFASNWDQLLRRPFTAQPLPPINPGPILTSLREALGALDDAPPDDGLTDYLRETVTPLLAELNALDDRFDILEALSRLTLHKKYPGDAQIWNKHGGKQRLVDALLEARAAQQEVLTNIGTAVTETLCARVQDFVLTQAERRRLEGRLKFHDLLVLTRDVLREDAQVRRRMHDRFTALMVDEFQDTDPLQVEIVHLIAGDCGERPPQTWEKITIAPGRLFFVGDPKQSIYRFRRADVTLYERVGELHRAEHDGLKVNFRSVRGVVQPVNELFGKLMLDQPGQVSYAELTPHRTGGESDRVTLLGGPMDEAKAAELREREAQHIVATIARARRDKWQVARQKGDPRSSDLTYADTAILLPTRTALPSLEKALQAADVPYRVESRSLVWATDAVRDVITILQALANPADEVAVVAALRQHGLACSDLDLTGWVVAGGRWDYLASTPATLSAEHPVAAGMAQLRAWHDLRWWLPVNHLVERVVRELRLVELSAEMPRPRDHWRRLRFVVDQARAFCDAGGGGLTDFVSWAVQQLESEADVLETAVPELDDDSVRILTVHGSKGLEFPLTVLAGLGIPPRFTADVLWGGSRPEARLKKDWLATGGFADQSMVEKTLSLAESIRLLYVAMTRAQDHLVVGCYHKPVKNKKKSIPSHAQNVWDELAGLPLHRETSCLPIPDESVPPDKPHGEAFDRGDFYAARAVLLSAIRAQVATSPTALVAAADQGRTNDATAATGAPAAPGKGAAIGSAVHTVLEMVDVARDDDAEITALTRLVCDELGIPELVHDVRTRVRTAVASPLVADAATKGRSWREAYVVAQDGEPGQGRYVEGYIDLLVEDEDGLRVVDYKTDRVTTDAEMAAKADHYRPQLAAYAAALNQVPGIDVHRGTLLFVGPEAAYEVDVPLAGSLPEAAPPD